jgi:MFS family permease
MTPAAPSRSSLGPWVVPLLALMVFVNYIDRGNLATASPLIKDELGLTSTQIGVLASAFFWTYTPGQLLSAWLADRINPYRTLAIGLALWSLATFLTGLAGGFTAILALRVVLGAGESAAFPCSSKLIAQHVPHTRLGATNALLSQGASLGPAMGVFFGGLMMAALGWRNVFLLFGALSITWLVPWLLATRRSSVEPVAAAMGPAPSFAAILKRRELWGASLGHVCGNYGFYFVTSWMPLYLVKARGFSVAQMATTGGVVYLAFAAAAIGGGWLTDRLIASGASGNVVRKLVFVIGNLGAAASLVACGLGDATVAIASLLAAGASFGFASPHQFAAAQTMAGPRATAKWVGLQNGIGSLSGIFGPVLTGMIIDRTGGYTAAFTVAGAVTLVSVIGWALVIPKIAPVDWEAARS